jgi:CHAT domain-containing protein
MSLAGSGFDAPAAAARWLDDVAALTPTALTDAQALALAWALKDAALASWASDPKRTQRCAALITQFTGHAEPALPSARAWTQGMAHLTRGEMTEAIACFDHARDTLLALGDHQRAAQSQLPKLIALTMLDRHDEALQCAQQTLAAFVKAGDGLGAGKVELNMGSMLRRQERYAQSAAMYKSAAVRFARARNTEHSVMADIGLANVLARQFQFDESIRLFDRCAMRARTHGLDSLHAVIDSNRGYLELRRGRYEQALPALMRAVEYGQTSDTPQERTVCQRDLADAYLALNLLPEALALYDQVVSTFEQLATPSEQARAQVQRAQALIRLGRLDAAEADLRCALTADANPLGHAMARAQLAAIALHRGDASAALADVEHAAAVFERAGVLHSYLQACLTQAQALVALQRWAPALGSLERVLSQADGLPDVAAAAHADLGALLLDGPSADAARAEVHARKAMHLLDDQQARLGGDEFKTAYGANKQAAHDLLLRIAMAAADAKRPVQLLQAMEQSRGQALRAAVLQSHDPQARPAPGLDHARREQLHWLHNEWHAAINERNDAHAQRVRQRIGEIEQAWLESQRRAQAAQQAGADHAGARGGAFDVAALQAALPEGAAWIEYALVQQRWAACVVTADAVHAVQGDSHGLRERLAQLRLQIDTQRFGAPTLRRHAPQMVARTGAHLQALHKQVWAPLAPLLAGIQRVIVSPHRELHYLPFAGLHDGQQWLVQRHEVQLAPSAAIWLAHRQRQHAAPTAPQRSGWRLTALGVGGDTLPHVRAEVSAVAAAFKAQGGQALVHLDGQATQAVLRAALPSTDVLHLACHGQFRADSPYFSALHLADGPLTLRDAASLPLKAQLVTLSACETGLSKVAPGDELLGLLRGFLMAGAPTVLSSLWTVDDAHTATLMGQFYRDLLAGQRPAAALRRAQCALIEQAPHPYHWAAFAVHGLG